MSWLLDTCVISEATKLLPNPRVLAWINAQEEATLYLSVITLGELHKGVAKLPDSRKRRELTKWVNEELTERFTGRILPVDEQVATVWGNLQAQADKSGKPLPTLDTFIAATAQVHELTIVTRNTPHMRASGVAIFDPWLNQ